MRIACIATSVIPSTTANSIQVVKACHALKQLGEDVNLYVPGVKSAPWQVIKELYGLDERFNITWIKVIDLLRRYDFVLKSLIKARSWGADIIYTWTIQAAFFAQLLRIPTIIEIHDVPTGKFAPSLFRIFINSGGKKKVLVITDALLNRLKLHYDENKLSGITQISPNGTELEVYRDLPNAKDARSNLGLPDTFTAVYTGHFYIGRGMDLLFDLAKELPEINFLWVGGQPEKVEYWRRKVNDANLKNVILTGFISKKELPLYQAAGDVLLMPYENVIEGSSGGNTVDICSPMKMFDYLATGRPIITSDLPVIHEVLNPNNAVFCRPNDVVDWENAIKKLQNDEKQRITLAQHALVDVKQYTWENRSQKALDDFYFA